MSFDGSSTGACTLRRVGVAQDERLYGAAKTRQLEQRAQEQLPAHTLMQRAGLAVARLALAVAPHSQCIWIACGPGNNGGDGYEAAMHLQRWGKTCILTRLGPCDALPADAAASLARAQAAGVRLAQAPPAEFDLCIDALFGIGTRKRAPSAELLDWVTRINQRQASVIAVDLPSGLDADTGVAHTFGIQADHTLSLLTLKPGLFTAQGKDHAGLVWFDSLGIDTTGEQMPVILPDACLSGLPVCTARPHASHKGSYGDVAIIGGATGMIGAALLAGSAALHGGAGRVWLGLLDSPVLPIDPRQPELMLRTPAQLIQKNITTVIGCGAGQSLPKWLAMALQQSAALVIDADGLNTLAAEPAHQQTLQARLANGWSTVLTPHPLEAARLLGCSTAEIQRDRLHCAELLAQKFCCTVVLKGSGTLIAQPGCITRINPTGNPRLASAGSGDVLAGMIGARLAQGLSAWHAAWHAVYQHGQLADNWPLTQPLTASELARHTGNSPHP